MSCEKFVIAAVAVFATMVAAMANRHSPHARTVELMDALNKTVCPIKIDIDEDPERVPRRIKVMRCAPDPSQRCMELGIPRHDCCSQHAHHESDQQHAMECVELVDTVLVHYPKSHSPHKGKRYRVPVGCTCIIEKSTRAEIIT